MKTVTIYGITRHPIVLPRDKLSLVRKEPDTTLYLLKITNKEYLIRTSDTDPSVGFFINKIGDYV